MLSSINIKKTNIYTKKILFDSENDKFCFYFSHYTILTQFTMYVVQNCKDRPGMVNNTNLNILVEVLC